MTVAIVDYGSGNLRSAAKAFERAAREAGILAKVLVTDDAEVVHRADRIVLPGVGAFADCRRGLGAVSGMVEALEEAVLIKGRPFLGICVGMQLLANVGVEHGRHEGLGWIQGEVRPITGPDATFKVPHMGWNALEFIPDSHPLLAGLAPGDHVYFVHSYHFVPSEIHQRLVSVDYGGPIAAMIGRDNLVGTQFHPEKSQAVGLRLITNFLRWAP
ncbi:MAG: imidazole glycerol phosphate synthase subunit HisH [Rhodospirillum sp.]|nr:imidazole glycerol phosphate synthase subunit HisH [Rhodospirillum sp.]MCF8487859.1 imidazole glycerol phosphate synthase subunit HisH [Rhodospirillum sp.]MCF8499181.1 imidazole glycerol phosphate synthase subunit HisH [Rhodospirillum sp.]